MTPTLPSGTPNTVMACSNEAPAGFQNMAFLFDGSADMAKILRVRNQSAPQIRMPLIFLGVASMHYYIDPIESPFEEDFVCFKLE